MKTTATTDQALHFTGRCEFKSNGYVLYGIRSADKQYDVTVRNGKASDCSERRGETCKGWKFTGHCKHATYAEQLEAARPVEQVVETSPVVVEQVAAAPVATATASERMMRAPLNGNREFSLLKR